MEDQYLPKPYTIENYARPSVTTDIALFTVVSKDADDYRKLPDMQLSLLLIKRGEHPFKDYWALPGGFVRPDETVEQTAYRELAEESGVKDVSLSQLEVFSEYNRDPRGWIISCTFVALAPSEQFKLRPDTDAIDSRWFALTMRELEKHTTEVDGVKLTTVHYQLCLTCEQIKLTAVIEKRMKFSTYNRSITYEIVSSEGLAFDHAKIITVALASLRNNLYTSLLAYNLLPETFTLTELQRVYEIILDRKLTVANFRRKIADYVVETGQYSTTAGHRPAKLYRRNLPAFEKND